MYVYCNNFLFLFTYIFIFIIYIYNDCKNDTNNIFNEIEVFMKMYTCNAFQFVECKNYFSHIICINKIFIRKFR